MRLQKGQVVLYKISLAGVVVSNCTQMTSENVSEELGLKSPWRRFSIFISRVCKLQKRNYSDCTCWR
ncbi:hypothetical protein CDAR_102951 [Caerostris darwini]|uniref:Uncharacterized protein n=1 Tax=Caerostris darwini TaxID=1538125 RepID=A0AAV4T4T5_9ARAC|nr:hypothetical protein CDAR_102951 [Caerostris darwini]